jgi:hypothetical protein
MHVLGRIALDHLDRLTDSTGLVQHAIYRVPRRDSGYTTDDNARALRLCVAMWHHHPDERMLGRVTTYLSFLEYARRPGRGFHNFLSYDRHWLDAEGCGDCQGQAVRSLAEVLGSSLPEDYRALARELIDSVLPTLADLRSLRAQAYVVLAWGRLWMAGVKDLQPLESVAWSAARRLLECYQRALRPDWRWFESRMTYANAVLPHALFIAARRWPKEAFLDVAEASLAFLDDCTTARAPSTLGAKGRGTGEDIFWPIGNDGWHPRGGDKAAYDQQPVEAVTMAEAALGALDAMGGQKHLATFRRCHAWFHGQNSLGLPLVDGHSGACGDGLQASGVNRNQGAESTLAYLAVELHNLEIQQPINGETELPCPVQAVPKAAGTA